MYADIELNTNVNEKKTRYKLFKNVLNMLIKNKAALIGLIIIFLLIIVCRRIISELAGTIGCSYIWNR